MAHTPALWYFDFISPFAYLQWQRLPALQALTAIEYRPILFAALLDHWGQKGPAEIPAKRAFTYRFAHWRAARDGVVLRCPPAHPFNPLAALRLSLALGATTAAIGAIFEHIWRDGLPGDSALALRPVAQRFGLVDIDAALAEAAVKTRLRENTAAAIAGGVFGVPTLQVGQERFWGDDASAMAEDYLRNPALFETDEYRRLANLPSSAQRRGGG